MAGQTMWLVVIVLVLAAAIIGFYLGRVSAGGARQKTVELEAEVERQKAELNEYRREVDTHFDQTASLFVSMAGSYKALFEHLNSGYEKLAGNEGRDLFRERIASLLLDGRQDEQSRYLLEDDKAAADEAADAVQAEDTAAQATAGDAETGSSKAADEPVTDTAAETGAEAPVSDAAQAEAEAKAEAETRAEAEAETRAEAVAASAEDEVPSAVTDAEQDVRSEAASDDSEAIKAAAAAASVSPESADGDAAAVRDESGVPLGAAGAGGVAEDKREAETART